MAIAGLRFYRPVALPVSRLGQNTDGGLVTAVWDRSLPSSPQLLKARFYEQ